MGNNYELPSDEECK